MVYLVKPYLAIHIPTEIRIKHGNKAEERSSLMIAEGKKKISFEHW